MPAATDAQRNTRVRVTLTLPSEVAERYESQARDQRTTLEALLAKRLTACIEHTAGRPLYFTDAERHRLEELCGGRLIESPEGALEYIRHMHTIDIAGVKLTLGEMLLTRLQSRVFSGETLAGVIEREVTRGLEEFVGLR